MKKQFLIFTILLACFCAKAAPVSEEEAQTLALNFVSNTFEQTRQSDNLTLVYSMPSFYVFNIGETGFVIMSADDSYSPVIGYSYEGVFDPDNMAPALQDYLNGINEERMQRGFVNADAETVRDWESLREYGRLVCVLAARKVHSFAQQNGIRTILITIAAQPIQTVLEAMCTQVAWLLQQPS
jgi:hypothetical protein